jgi:hypothetical protein
VRQSLSTLSDVGHGRCGQMAAVVAGRRSSVGRAPGRDPPAGRLDSRPARVLEKRAVRHTAVVEPQRASMRCQVDGRREARFTGARGAVN